MYQQCKSYIDSFIHKIIETVLIFSLLHISTAPSCCHYHHHYYPHRSNCIHPYHRGAPDPSSHSLLSFCALNLLEARRRNANICINKFNHVRSYYTFILMRLQQPKPAYICSLPTLGGCSKYIDSLLFVILCTFCLSVSVSCIKLWLTIQYILDYVS